MTRKVRTPEEAAGESRDVVVPSVDHVTGQVSTWIGMAMQMSNAQSMTDSFGKLHDLGLTMPQLVALHVMAFEGAVTMTQLAERIGLSTSAVSHLLHRLVQMGLCEREDDPDDRRQKRVRLTTSGLEVARAVLRQRMAGTRASIEPLSAETRRKLSEVLDLVVNELAAQLPQRPQHPATSAGCPRHAMPDHGEDLLRRLEEFGDDVAESAAAVGDAIADSAAAIGDRIADRAAGIGDRIAESAAESAADLAADVGRRILKTVKARVAPKPRNTANPKQEKP